MGNKIGGRRKQVVEDKYTRPQGLYQIKDVDFKKLRKLILESKLAPCYPASDDSISNSNSSLLEECPICFLYYPTLNRSRCCMKSICTECFLQMKNPNSTRPTQCPFCKTSNYAVEYRGGKSKEERGMEQIEEQKVIEAKIRIRQQEMQEEEERQHRKEETNSANTDLPTESTSGAVECEETSPSQDTSGTQMLRQVQYNTRHGRDDEFDLDLEDIMVMEAIWLSIQENGRTGSSLPDNTMPEPYAVQNRYMSSVVEPMAVGSSSSPSGGLACAIAALAERQQLTGESSSSYNGLVSPLDMLPSSTRSSKRVKKAQRRPTDSSSAKVVSSLRTAEGCEVGPSSEVFEVGTSYVNSNYSEDETDVQPPPPVPLQGYHNLNSKRMKNLHKRCSFIRDTSKNLIGHSMVPGEWEFNNHGSDEAGAISFVEAGATFASSDDSDDEIHQAPVLPPAPPPPLALLSSFHGDNTSSVCSEGNEDHGEYILPPPPPQLYVTDSGFQSSIPGPIVPESFEEQMMLAMAVSLAEARARTTAQGVAWH